MPNKTTGKKTHPLTFVKHFFVKKQKAFTLIEIMIAMAIIAILATAGIQAYNGYIKK
jgi:prepilin-type N-terminal cleavage/methylation domain-containing protein